MCIRDRYFEALEEFGDDFDARMGAEAVRELLRDQFNLRMQKATGQLGQSHLLSQVKRDICLLYTSRCV